MGFAVDHVLHAVNDPYDVRRGFEDRFSLHGTAGGKHPDWGTYNELAYFDLSYIEWIGIQNFILAARSRFGREVMRSLSVREGVGQFALRTHEMDAIVADWARRGLPFWGPAHGERIRPDGTVIRWRLLFPGHTGSDDYALPFLIEWAESDEERRAALTAAGAIGRQPQDLRLSAIHSLVGNIDDFRESWEPYFGPMDSEEIHIPDIGDYVACEMGGVRVCFWRPESIEFRQELERYGERPVQIDLLPHGQPEVKGVLDASLEAFHGLRLNVLSAEVPLKAVK
ncbi:VOC family protein [Alicyclobacillus ferrooxydans]|uniref:VOC family protein n=1 Tax=Alicyclobacillus ferrooxydans TaxID=471514 RepID=UPI0006D5940C|nr:VOC family protein [Alicyclobacillus ferrooxydans]